MTDASEIGARAEAWGFELAGVLSPIGVAVTTSFGDVTVDAPRERWVDVLQSLRDDASLSFFDWLSAVDEGGEEGFTVFCHLYDPVSHRHALVRTSLPRQVPRLASVTSVFRGASWHERETAEMFGITFEGHPHPERLLLSDDFDGHPLRKDFVLTARASKSWPGAKEPGESGEGAPTRRRMQPPGVPDPAWGPREVGRTDD